MKDKYSYVSEALKKTYHPIPFVNSPTPVMPLSLLGIEANNVWIKRDDLSSPVYGGNKTRKLAFILRNNGRKVLTFGPWGSHHVYSTAVHSRLLGKSTTAILVPQPMTPHHEEVHQKILQVCDEVIKVTNVSKSAGKLIRFLASYLKPNSPKYDICPPGGTNPLGTLGYVLGGLELAMQVKTKKLPAPAKIFVPLGTGGTAVGISIGLAMAGLQTKTIAVRVVPKAALPEWVLSLLKLRTLRLITRAGLTPPPFKSIRLGINNTFNGRYAISSPAADNALLLAQQAGVELESTYSAKTMAALVEETKKHPEDGPYLFWQTFAPLQAAQISVPSPGALDVAHQAI